MTTKQDLATRVGTLVKNLPELHDVEYKVVYNLHENTFFQKLISEKVLKDVRVRPVDYFKALVFLTYFTGVIEEDYTVCENLVKISKALREEEKKEGKNGQASYLNIGTVVIETGLCAKEKGDSRRSNIKSIIGRYESQKINVDFSSESLRKPDLYYEAIGQMVLDLVEEKRRELLADVTSRVELEAVVFTDCILGILKDKNHISEINNALDKKDYFEASLIALDRLGKEASLSLLESYVEENRNG